MSSRRQFLKQSASAAGGVLIASSSWGNFFIGKKPRIIIIGAGFSGLAAAYNLFKKNVDFVVLEARNRISGRVFSHVMDEKENLIIELGAEWVGNSHTRIHELCKELDLELLNNQMNTHLIYKNEYFNDKQWHYSEAWENKFKALVDGYTNMSEKEKDSFRHQLDKTDWWHYLIEQGCTGRDLDIRELADSTDFGESIRHVSACAAFTEYAESSPKNEMDLKIKGGNSMLAKKIKEKIGKDKIKLQHRVQRIVQDKNGVKVFCDNGEQFVGDKIICTIPAFSLKKIQWEPALPGDQLQAINELQYARINKNPLLFSKRFWKEEGFDMITDQSSHYFYHATMNQRSEKGVLISYSIGEKAAVIANQSDDWKANAIQQTLQPFFGDVKTLLEKQANYYWGADEFSYGAYALYGVNQWFPVRETLGRRFIHTRFAGEHLADWQGFMEGALVTGEEAANLIA